MSNDDSLKAFSHHGVTFNAKSGNQAIGDCPFCGKTAHFYANVEKKLWDCKVCGAHGNQGQFLEQISNRNKKYMDEETLRKLAIDRKLPYSAFKGWGVGYDPDHEWYTIPVKGITGQVDDLRTYKLGEKSRATTGAKLGLMGAEHISDAAKNLPIYICEGEWDAVALRWLANKLKLEVVITAVPGASVFKQDWIPWFEGRQVIAMHDHDAAGDQGRKIVRDRLTGIANLVREIRWPDGLPDGFDVRDLVIKEAIKAGKPKAAWTMLQSMVADPEEGKRASDAPSANQGAAEGGVKGPVMPKPKSKLDHVKVYEAYKKWMHLPSDEVLRVMFGAIFANKLQGDPIWLFLVAPPGGSKSELLSSMSASPLVESTTALTPHSLVSGAALFNGQDPSLLPKLNGRVLVIKDFTTILSMHYTSRDEIFGVLRDAYDGVTTKTFGTGLKRTYVSHFGIIAGVTPKIEEFGVVHQSLGERFLKYRINTGQKTLSEADRIRRALANINHEKEMKTDLGAVACDVLCHPLPKVIPPIPHEIGEYIVSLAQTCATMRGVVDREKYSGMVTYKPATEVGTRLAKQLAKLGMGMAIYQGKKMVDLDIYRVIRKVALNTAPDRVEEIIKQVWKRTADPKATLKTGEISFITRLPVTTCFRVLQDLELLQVMDRIGQGNKFEWRLNKTILKLIKEGRVYERGSGAIR